MTSTRDTLSGEAAMSSKAPIAASSGQPRDAAETKGLVT
jgi:hypothetical protein